jgi:hypothetical protein
MPIERALNAYQTERLNCAQSILRAFQEHRNIPEDVILQAKQLGGGRAEDGLCGALYTALQLVDDPAERQRMREAFTASAGSDKCREIRRAAQVPCVECVKIAAGLVHQSGTGTAKP